MPAHLALVVDYGFLFNLKMWLIAARQLAAVSRLILLKP